MEEGHGVTVSKFLGSISFDKPFSFLDIGCGNGWVVRKIANHPKCKKAMGIDKSKNMIKRAVSKMVKLATHHPMLAVRQFFNIVKGA